MTSFDLSDTQRRLNNMMAIGIIEEADYGTVRARVRIDEDHLTGWLPIMTDRAGPDRDWHPPEVGEHVVMLAPAGRLEAAIIIGSLFCDDNPAPRGRADVREVAFADGASVSYDRTAHHMEVTLPAGSLRVSAPGGVTIIGDVAVTGEITATGDVMAGGISLQQHKHGGVQSGGAQTGAPV